MRVSWTVPLSAALNDFDLHWSSVLPKTPTAYFMPAAGEPLVMVYVPVSVGATDLAAPPGEKTGGVGRATLLGCSRRPAAEQPRAVSVRRIATLPGLLLAALVVAANLPTALGVPPPMVP